jgi:Tfp pilus assembly protein PilF
MALAQKLLQTTRARGRLLLALLILGLIGISVYFTVRTLRGSSLVREAEQALQANDLAGARTALLACLEIRPNHPEALFLLARTARRAGDYQNASAYLEQYRQVGGISEAIELENGLAAFQRGHISVPLERLLSAYVQKSHPDTIVILEAMSKGYLTTYRLPQALDCLDALLERRPKDIQGLLLRGRTLEKLQRSKDALVDFARVVELDPASAEARVKLGEALIHTKRFSEASEQFEWLRAQKPQETTVLLGLARCYRAVGKSNQAKPLLDEILKNSPNHVDALVERGKDYLEATQPEKAAGCFRRAAQQSPYHREAIYHLVLCLNQLGGKSDIEKWKGRLTQIDGGLKRLGEITKTIAQTPNNPDLRCEAGKIFLANGNDNEGLRWLESALQENPNHQETHKVLRDYYREHGQTERASVHEQALTTPVKGSQTTP